jgi:hypothetical protein
MEMVENPVSVDIPIELTYVLLIMEFLAKSILLLEGNR